LYSLLITFTFLLVYYIPGCGDDATVTVNTPVPTATPIRTATPTTVPVTPSATAIPSPTVTPTPSGNVDLLDQFDLASAFFVINALKENKSGAGTLVIRLRQKIDSAYAIKYLDLNIDENPSFPFFNTFATGGPSGWETGSGQGILSWLGTTAMPKNYTYEFEINYNTIPNPGSMSKPIKLIFKGGDGLTKLGYIQLSISGSVPKY